jgi:hypothetical protein
MSQNRDNSNWDEMVFVVKVKQFGHHDRKHLNTVATTLFRFLGRAFGLDRVQIWHEGEHLVYNPASGDQIDGIEQLMETSYGDSPLAFSAPEKSA